MNSAKCRLFHRSGERLIQICGGMRQRTVKGDEGIQARFRQHRLFL